MIFGEFDSGEASGIILAHSVNLGARKLRKGQRLDDEDIEALKEAGIACIRGARLQDDDIDENRAAQELARLLAGENTEADPAAAGRCDIRATKSGLALVAAEVVDRLNELDEAIAVATLPPYFPVQPGDVVATVKIVTFAVNRAALDRACQSLALLRPLRVAGFERRRVALIVSDSPQGGDRLLYLVVGSTRVRLESMENRLALVLKCGHDADSIRAMIHQALAAGCDFLLTAGATATQDRNDIVPRAIEMAGGKIDHFGIPVDPGSMLLLAHVDSVPIVNLPGCARSPSLNGFDWVLRRLLAGLEVSRQDLVRMGVGGLIKGRRAEQDRPLSRPEDLAPDAPRLAAVVLAAGRATRMGENKLLVEVDGVPLLLRVVNAALASLAERVVVVTGNDAARIEQLLSGKDVSLIHNSEYATGLSSSLRKGLDALPEEIDGAMVLLGDMPLLTAGHLDRILSRFDPAHPEILVPEWRGLQGNPVVWPRAFFPEMRKLSGDRGAKGLLRKFSSQIEKVRFGDDAVMIDIDKSDDLSRLRSA
jgi:molybdenum cofactor cytidylyltransferase